MEQNWTTIIKPKNKLMDLKLKEIWQYRDLIMMFVKRDFKTLYKQTVLGPLWILITPLLRGLIVSISSLFLLTFDKPEIIKSYCG